MGETDIPTQWQLSITNRVVRAAIGITAILSALLIQGLSEGWVFILAVLGLYTTQTAFFNIELLYAFFSLPDVDETPGNEEEVKKLQHSGMKKQ